MRLTQVQSKCYLDASTPSTSSAIGLKRDATASIIFIDRQVPDLKQLITGILPGIKVVLLDSEQDGIQQITNVLKNLTSFSTIHIASHGRPGCLYLGNSQLNLETLHRYTKQLQSWFSSSSKYEVSDLTSLSKTMEVGSLEGLTENKLPVVKTDLGRANLLLYGCNVAAGDAGVEFIEKLHQVTGAEIAASTSLTGHKSQGGNWNLDLKTSPFKPSIAFTPEVQRQWNHVLTSFDDLLDFGDAPISYGDANHRINQTIGLGTATIDEESMSQPTIDADGDDNDGNDDEDALTTLNPLVNNVTSYSLTFPVTNNTGDSATVLGWIDFDRDGAFAPSEGVSVAIADDDNTATLTWNTPNSPGFANLTPGNSYARFRITTDTLTNANSTGTATDGEVEDYTLTILGVPTVDLDGNNSGTDLTASFNGLPVAIGNNLQVTDPDSSNLSQATITITNPIDGNNETLNINSADLPPGITVQGNGTSTLILSGAASPEDYQIAIASVTYNNTTLSPNPNNRNITLQVTDTDNLTSNIAETTIILASTDFGDAPVSYGDASHSINQNIGLGTATIDAETASQPTANADGDNNDGNDDEDAFTTLTPLTDTATSYSLNVPVTNTTGKNATVLGWIDFNADGTFTDDEGVTAAIANGATTASLTWNAANSAGFSNLTFGTSYARFRISSDNLITEDATGVATDGEVEDYTLAILGLPTVDLDSDNPGTDFTIEFNSTPVSISNNIQVTDPDSQNLSGSVVTISNPLNGSDESLNIDPADIPDQITVTGNGTNTITITGNASPEDYQAIIEAITYNNIAVSPDLSPRTIEVQVTDTDNITNNTAQTTITLAPTDFGDAPASYGNANHGINQNISLGTGTIDAEIVPQPTINADGDDNDDNDDEDAIASLDPITDNVASYSLTIPITNNTGESAIVLGWIDFDGDGTFAANEGVTTAIDDGDTTTTLTWDVANSPGFANLTPGNSYARLRITTEDLTNADFEGAAADGEVEDYPLSILGVPSINLDANDQGTDLRIGFTGTPVAVANNIQITDADSPNLSGSAITLTNPQDGSDEQLIPPLNLPSGITLDSASTANHIILTGEASLADYQAAIAAITYNNSAISPNPTPRTVTVELTDPDNLSSNLAETTIFLPPFDFGDAPSGYGDASHTINQNIGFGNGIIDSDPTSQSTVNADGDDNDGNDDEDGFTTLDPLVDNASSYSLSLPVTNTTGENAVVLGWIDFNADGAFEANEGVTTTVADGGTIATLNWNAANSPGLTNLIAGNTYARLRITTDSLTTEDSQGIAANGEVEDYTLSILGVPTIDLDSDNTGTDFITNFNDLPVNIGNNISITDSESPNLSGSVIRITNPQDGSDETLNIDPANIPNGITVTGNNSSEITISGNASLADYQAIINAITYNNTAENRDSTPRTITVQVTDTDNFSSNIAQTTIVLGPFDFGDAPNSYGDASHTINQNIGLGSTTIDAELATPFSVNADGDNNNGNNDEDAFTSLDSIADNTTSYSLTVPVTNNTGESARVLGWIDFNGDGTFAANEGVSATIANGETSANLTWNGANSLGFNNLMLGDSYARFRISTDNLTTADVTGIATDGEVEDYTISIIAGNNPPIAEDDLITTDPNIIQFITPLDNDSDPNSDPLTIIDFNTENTIGQVEPNGEGFRYTPETDFTGTDTFTYTISDGNGGIDTATVAITINDLPVTPPTNPPSNPPTNSPSDPPSNNPPVANNDQVSTIVDQEITIPVLDNDSNSLSISEFDSNSVNGGTITEDDNQLIYTPPSGFIGTDTFTYTINNDDGGFDTATVTIEIDAVIDSIPQESPDCEQPPLPEAIAITLPPSSSATPPFPPNSNPTILGTEEPDNLQGTEAADQINAFEGNDSIMGLGGNDTLNAGQNDDLVDAGVGDDLLFGGEGNDTLIGGAGGETPLGDNGEQDVIRGNAGDDLILGTLGNDTLNGGRDNDDLRGGKDNDLILGEVGNDTLLGEQGDDTLFGGTLNILENGTENGVGDLEGQDVLFGGSGNDFLLGNEADDQVIGAEGDDTAFGGQDNDFLWGSEGNDVLYGDRGEDSLCGNADNDTLFGGVDDDIAWGGAGDDVLFGDEGDDTLVGGLGSDTMTGGEGNDLFVIFGNEANNVIEDFQVGQDQIVLGDSLTFAQLELSDDGNGNTNITLNEQLLMTVNGVAADSLTSEQFLSFQQELSSR